MEAGARTSYPVANPATAVRPTQRLQQRRSPYLASSATKTATRSSVPQTARHTDYALHAGPATLRNFIRSFHSPTKRHYAIQTALPADIDERRPPPLLLPQQYASDTHAQSVSRPWLIEQKSPKAERKRTAKGRKRVPALQSDQQDAELVDEDIWAFATPNPQMPEDLVDLSIIEAYGRVNQGAEGNLPMIDRRAAQHTTPRNEVDSGRLQRSTSVRTAVPIPKVRSRARLSRSERLEADTELLQPSKWTAVNKRAAVKLSDSAVNFDLFRAGHRLKMWESEYLPSQIIPHREADDAQQPHDSALLSRYDWRLTSPSTSARHRAIFGQRHIWRKKQPQQSHESDASMQGYTEYSAKYSRFIALERKEAEDAALQRLKKRAGRVWMNADARVDSVSGLLAEVHRNHSAKKEQRLEARLPPLDEATGAVDDIEAVALEQLDRNLTEEADKATNEGQSTLVSFHLPQNADLPINEFHKGKMTFIWQCHFDNSAQRWRVPPLEDTALAWQDIKDIPARAYVQRAYANRIDVSIPGSNHLPGSDTKPSHYRLDVGYDDTSFMRMQAALEEGLQVDAAGQRDDNDLTSKGPHKTHRDVQLQGTEIRDVVLQDFSKHSDEGDVELDESQPRLDLYSETLMDDQRLASWARRYARDIPM